MHAAFKVGLGVALAGGASVAWRYRHVLTNLASGQLEARDVAAAILAGKLDELLSGRMTVVQQDDAASVPWEDTSPMNQAAAQAYYDRLIAEGNATAAQAFADSGGLSGVLVLRDQPGRGWGTETAAGERAQEDFERQAIEAGIPVVYDASTSTPPPPRPETTQVRTLADGTPVVIPGRATSAEGTPPGTTPRPTGTPPIKPAPILTKPPTKPAKPITNKPPRKYSRRDIDTENFA
jgi:hypothetical protein